MAVAGTGTPWSPLPSQVYPGLQVDSQPQEKHSDHVLRLNAPAFSSFASPASADHARRPKERRPSWTAAARFERSSDVDRFGSNRGTCGLTTHESLVIRSDHPCKKRTRNTIIHLCETSLLTMRGANHLANTRAKRWFPRTRGDLGSWFTTWQWVLLRVVLMRENGIWRKHVESHSVAQSPCRPVDVCPSRPVSITSAAKDP